MDRRSCPTCGQAVEVVHGDEGTSHFTQPEATRTLWEAATELWDGYDDDADQPIPLNEQLFDSAEAYPGTPVKGKVLYRIGVELGLIEEVER